MSLASDLDGLRKGGLLISGDDRAWITMRGKDAPDFLQRILTSDVHQLAPGSGQWSAMLDGKGHWISDVLLYALPDAEEVPSFGLDIPIEQRDVVLQKLEMMHFGEALEFEGTDLQQLLILTDGAPAHVFGVENANEHGPDTWILQRPDRGVNCTAHLLPAAAVADCTDALQQAGAVLGDAATLEHLRIRAFRPRWGADFDADTTLPNCNEWQRSSITKGCYAGQEVIAKINTYGEAPRQLCQLRFATAAATVDFTGAELRNDAGKRMGKLSSYTLLEDGSAVGLGMLRRRAAVEGGAVVAVLEEAQEMAGVVHLPEKVFG
ncbi:MAG: YgfZ/GcvT domain-containing protein [Planctomycetota bacterium]